MWVLNASSRTLEYFNDATQIPGGYAILSHTWGNEEVSFQNIESADATTKNGYAKIDHACRQALIDDLNYVWIDTCCIDKKSSAELSEAINSMFKWYKNATICYAYLSDVSYWSIDKSTSQQALPLPEETSAQISTSRWFTRGWTLQELIAPTVVQFFDYYWNYLGQKSDLLDLLYQNTRIDVEVLRGVKSLQYISVANRMSWASARSTSRIEDQAYSLLGIFDVNIPLLYGEGAKAFLRLQEEIIRSSAAADHSLLAHSMIKRTLLATSPEAFHDAQNIVSWTMPQMQVFEMSPTGLRLSLYIRERVNATMTSHANDAKYDDLVQIALNCRYADRPMTHLVLLLKKRPRIGIIGISRTNRTANDEIAYDPYDYGGTESPLKNISMQELRQFTPKVVKIARVPYMLPDLSNKVHLVLDSAFLAVDSFPTSCWDSWTSTITVPTTPNNASLKPAYRAGIVIANSRTTRELWRQIVVALDISAGFGLNVNDKSPYIKVATSPRRDLKSLEIAPFEPAFATYAGETEVLNVANRPTVKITAELAMAMGELVWSLRLEPA